MNDSFDDRQNRQDFSGIDSMRKILKSHRVIVKDAIRRSKRRLPLLYCLPERHKLFSATLDQAQSSSVNFD